MMIGLPGSGKSTYAEELSIKENATIHSSDRLREELFGNANEVDKNEELFKELHKRIKNDLTTGINVIYDATNISHKRRKGFIQELKKINCEKVCYLMATPYKQCIELIHTRDRKVPEHVIKKMYLNFYVPQYYEGWDEINIVWNFDISKFNLHSLFMGENGLNYIEQETPYHTLTIGDHCIKCNNICAEISNGNYKLTVAALFHDIGKNFVKEYNETKNHCTYYQHHLVSAYDTLFYLKGLLRYSDEEILKICNYIQWHMQPYFLKTETSINKFKALVGEDFYNDLLILNEADRKAK